MSGDEFRQFGDPEVVPEVALYGQEDYHPVSLDVLLQPDSTPSSSIKRKLPGDGRTKKRRKISQPVGEPQAVKFSRQGTGQHVLTVYSTSNIGDKLTTVNSTARGFPATGPMTDQFPALIGSALQKMNGGIPFNHNNQAHVKTVGDVLCSRLVIPSHVHDVHIFCYNQGRGKTNRQAIVDMLSNVPEDNGTRKVVATAMMLAMLMRSVAATAYFNRLKTMIPIPADMHLLDCVSQRAWSNILVNREQGQHPELTNMNTLGISEFDRSTIACTQSQKIAGSVSAMLGLPGASHPSMISVAALLQIAGNMNAPGVDGFAPLIAVLPVPGAWEQPLANGIPVGAIGEISVTIHPMMIYLPQIFSSAGACSDPQKLAKDNARKNMRTIIRDVWGPPAGGPLDSKMTARGLSATPESTIFNTCPAPTNFFYPHHNLIQPHTPEAYLYQSIHVLFLYIYTQLSQSIPYI